MGDFLFRWLVIDCSVIRNYVQISVLLLTRKPQGTPPLPRVAVKGKLLTHREINSIALIATRYTCVRVHLQRAKPNVKAIFYRPQTKLRKGNVLHLSVTVFTGGNVHTLGRHPPMQTPHWADIPRGRAPPWADTPLGKHPPSRDMVNLVPNSLQRTIHILLECILVFFEVCGVRCVIKMLLIEKRKIRRHLQWVHFVA